MFGDRPFTGAHTVGTFAAKEQSALSVALGARRLLDIAAHRFRKELQRKEAMQAQLAAWYTTHSPEPCSDLTPNHQLVQRNRANHGEMPPPLRLC